MPNGKEEQPKSEAVERPWASNDKLTYDASLGHIKALMSFSELSVKQAIEFHQKSNDQYLVQTEQIRTQFAEHCKNLDTEIVNNLSALHKNALENNRYTLDRLYSVFPEEAAGIATMVSLVVEALKQAGWTPAETPQ